MSDSEKPKSSWRERRQSIKHKWLVPFIFPEWLCEWVSYFLGRWAFLDILGHVGRLTILVAVIFYFFEADERRLQSTSLRMQVENLGLQLKNQRKAKHYQAWQVINSAQGKPGSGGRMDALQDLHRDGISLAGLDISKAHLPKLNLENADLQEANLAGANLLRANLAEAELSDANFAGAALTDANFAGAVLRGANLTEAELWGASLAGANLFLANLAEAELSDANLAGAILTDANFAGAVLRGANLTEANLFHANLSEAKLFRANLTEAELSDANLAGAILTDANFAGAVLRGANLAEAELWGANLTGAYLQRSNLRDIKNWQEVRSIKLANIYGVENPPDGFIEWAIEHGAVNIEDKEEWIKLVREKRQEKTKEK